MDLASWIRTRRPRQVYYGWWVVSAWWVMAVLVNGIFFRGFIVFFVPVRDALSITNFQASLVFSLGRAEGGVEGPVAGWMIDRFGARKLVIGGVLLAGLGYIALWSVDSFLWFALVYLGLISLGNSVAFQNAMIADLNMWFIRRRAFVMSLVAAGSSVGPVVLIPILSLIILRAGWEWAAFISGFVYLLLVLPLSLLIRASPESMGLLRDGDPPQAVESATSSGRGIQSQVPFPARGPSGVWGGRGSTYPRILASSSRCRSVVSSYGRNHRQLAAHPHLERR